MLRALLAGARPALTCGCFLRPPAANLHAKHDQAAPARSSSGWVWRRLPRAAWASAVAGLASAPDRGCPSRRTGLTMLASTAQFSTNFSGCSALERHFLQIVQDAYTRLTFSLRTKTRFKKEKTPHGSIYGSFNLVMTEQGGWRIFLRLEIGHQSENCAEDSPRKRVACCQKRVRFWIQTIGLKFLLNISRKLNGTV